MELALELAQEALEGGDLGGVVFVALVEADHGIQDQEDGLGNCSGAFGL